jgi:hypothetical protein
VWHLPGPPTGTTRALLGLVAAEVGHSVGIRSLPKLAVRGLGLVNPMLRELAETHYQFEEPFVPDITSASPSSGVLAPRWPTPSPRPWPGTGPGRERQWAWIW